MRHLREQNLGINEIMGANWDPNSLCAPIHLIFKRGLGKLSPPYSCGLGVEGLKRCTVHTVQYSAGLVEGSKFRSEGRSLLSAGVYLDGLVPSPSLQLWPRAGRIGLGQAGLGHSESVTHSVLVKEIPSI